MRRLASLLVAVSCMAPDMAHAGEAAPPLSLWRAVEQRTLASKAGIDPAIVASVAEKYSRKCRPERDDGRTRMSLSQLTSPTAGSVGVRSAYVGGRNSFQTVSILAYGITMHGPWVSLDHHRGLVHSVRRTTRIETPDRYQDEDWGALQQLRSGKPQGDAEIEHEITVWERQGSCPPGIGPGFVTDEELRKAASKVSPEAAAKP